MAEWVVVFEGELAEASLLLSFLAGDQLSARLLPNVKSPPLQSPGPHQVKSQFQRYFLLVPEDQADRARELIHFYQTSETPTENS
ncbi:MAG: hypothetical protein ABIN58_13800 [candidate division WOR-3 bacterium]